MLIMPCGQWSEEEAVRNLSIYPPCQPSAAAVATAAAADTANAAGNAALGLRAQPNVAVLNA